MEILEGYEELQENRLYAQVFASNELQGTGGDCLEEYSLSSFDLTPGDDGGSCQYRVTKIVPTVCQISLEFNDFDIDCDNGGR